MKFYTIDPNKIDLRIFDDFTYSKRSHFRLLDKYSLELNKKRIDIDDADLKRYQDLLVFSFIKNHIPVGSKILDIGGGNSRILSYFKNKYECWNVDKFEGNGSGPTKIYNPGYSVVVDYIGNFNHILPDNYFDFVFSISTLEHVPREDDILYKKINDDINRVLKPKGYSLHCIDVTNRGGKVWSNNILHYFFKNNQTVNKFIPFDKMVENSDLYYMSEKAYYKTWYKNSKKSYDDMGKPFSCNILWQKPSASLTKSDGHNMANEDNFFKLLRDKIERLRSINNNI
ncbi:MAG: methyltransferase domain-containing protein [Candidatus Staskawiczbacteria bacterium]|nr:methyltransferase domain-containing protein [Candidatus Staskawiczbacteria bacterium]